MSSLYRKVLWLPWDSFKTSGHGYANRLLEAEPGREFASFQQIWGKRNVGKCDDAALGAQEPESPVVKEEGFCATRGGMSICLI